MIKTIRVMLVPNNKQKTKLFQYANTARFAYNWALAKEQENYKNGEKFISDYALRKEFTQLKKLDKYSWLNGVSCDVPKQAIKDACNSYKKFFNGLAKYPKFKNKKQSAPSFYQDSKKIQFTDTHVKVEGFANSKRKNKQKLNWIKLAEYGRIPTKNCKYCNVRIKYDGLNWYLTVVVENTETANIPVNDGIGIDLGIKSLSVCSDGTNYKNINKTKTVERLEKRKRRLQRSIARKYEKNKKGDRYCKTSNIIKSEKKLLKLTRRLTNIRQNYIHQTTTEIIKREPKYIVLEDLDVNNMKKNKYLSEALQQQSLYEFRRQIEYKAEWNNIKVIIADKFYPSSKLCSCCGNIKRDLKLSDRIYKCECGNVIDRDYQASINLKQYGENVLSQQAVS